MSRCHIAICRGAFLGVARIAASFGTCADSLVVVGGCCSLPVTAYISRFWLDPIGRWQVVGV
jgi:hypothetical protein